MRKLKNFLVVFILAFVFLGIGLTRTWFYANLYAMLDEPLYGIPAESNILEFHVLETNPGSGGWWIYAEDSGNYYFNKGIYITKNASKQCQNFDPENQASWCQFNHSSGIYNIFDNQNLIGNWGIN